jgi:hypothetical protein
MLRKFKQFWSEERSLTTLLALLAINMFILGPLIREGAGIALLRDIFFSLLLVAGLLTMTRHKALQVVFILFVALAVIVHWAQVAFSRGGLSGWDAFFPYEKFSGCGYDIARKHLAGIAEDRGIAQFHAEVLRENRGQRPWPN